MPWSNFRSHPSPSRTYLHTPLLLMRCASWGLCTKFEYRLACGMCFGQPPKPNWESCTHTHTSVLVCVCLVYWWWKQLQPPPTSRWAEQQLLLGSHIVVICTSPCIHLDHRQTLCHLSELRLPHPRLPPNLVRLAAPFVQIWSVACGAAPSPSASCHCASVINFRTTPPTDSSQTASLSVSSPWSKTCCCCSSFALFILPIRLSLVFSLARNAFH